MMQHYFRPKKKKDCYLRYKTRFLPVRFRFGTFFPSLVVLLILKIFSEPLTPTKFRSMSIIPAEPISRCPCSGWLSSSPSTVSFVLWAKRCNPVPLMKVEVPYSANRLSTRAEMVVLESEPLPIVATVLPRWAVMESLLSAMSMPSLMKLHSSPRSPKLNGSSSENRKPPEIR